MRHAVAPKKAPGLPLIGPAIFSTPIKSRNKREAVAERSTYKT